MTTTTTTTWRELFPEGRHVFYEGDDPEGFCAEINAGFGFDPSNQACHPDGCGWLSSTDRPGARICRDRLPWGITVEGNESPTYFFWCPPEHLDAIYGSDRWPMGS